MTPAKKLILIAALQALILLSVVGFRQYAVLTGDTVILKATTRDPRELTRSYSYVQFEISQIDRSSVLVDGDAAGDVYVEVQRGSDGYWHAVAVHDDRRRSFPGTVLIEGHSYAAPGRSQIQVDYGIESAGISRSDAGAVPSGAGHSVGVEVQVDRFGAPIAQRFIIDGVWYDLSRR